MIRILLTLAALAVPTASAQPTVTEWKCDLGDLWIDGRCQPVIKFSHPIGVYTPYTTSNGNTLTVPPAPQCPDGYELVLRAPTIAACARDFADPIQ